MREDDERGAAGDRRADAVGRDRPAVVGRDANGLGAGPFPRRPDVRERRKLQRFVHDLGALAAQIERRGERRLEQAHVRRERDRAGLGADQRPDPVADRAYVVEPPGPGPVRPAGGPLLVVALEGVARGERRRTHRVRDQPRVGVESGESRAYVDHAGVLPSTVRTSQSSGKKRCWSVFWR